MPFESLAQKRRNAKAAKAEETFSLARNAQTGYRRDLFNLTRQVARIIKNFAPEAEDEPIAPPAMARIEVALSAYAKAIAPWARATANRMIAEVNRRNITAWKKYTEGMSIALKAQLATAPVGETMQEILAQQVDLITSLPWEAARRTQEKSMEALYTGSRYPERHAEIEQSLAEAHPDATAAWLRSRAELIARTETARAASVLTQARAKHIGAESYTWTAVMDWKTRPRHRELNGHEFRWDDPPMSDPPDYHSHPGQIFNCRCVALPIIE